MSPYFSTGVVLGLVSLLGCHPAVSVVAGKPPATENYGSPPIALNPTRWRHNTPANSPGCKDVNATSVCHGWTAFGSVGGVSIDTMECRAVVPDIPEWFGTGRATGNASLYLYCNVVADGSAGAGAQKLFGQLVPQIMIGNSEVCGGVNHSALGNGTHVPSATWLAQAQYFWFDAATSAPKCIGGPVIAVDVGATVVTRITFWGAGPAEVSIAVDAPASAAARGSRDRSRTAQRQRVSRLLVPSPQLDPGAAWSTYVANGTLRPYVAFEAWDARADWAAAYPSTPWDVHALLAGRDGNATFSPWEPASTGMKVTATAPQAARWEYSIV